MRRSKQNKILYYSREHFSKKLAFDLDTKEERTAWILAKYPKTRDNDTLLVLLYWRNYYKEGVLLDYISLLNSEDFGRLPNPYDIIRSRKKIQNELKLFLPSEETQAVRDQKESVCHDHFSKGKASGTLPGHYTGLGVSVPKKALEGYIIR